MSIPRRLVVAVLVSALLVPVAVAADESDPPWGPDAPSPVDTVKLQAAAHRMIGQSDTNELEVVAQVYDLLQGFGVDADTATKIAAQQALSIEAVQHLNETRRRRNGLRRFFGKIPIVRRLTDGIWKLIGRSGRRIVRGASPELTDVAFAVLTGGGSAVKILFKSRLRAVKRALIEDAGSRLLARGVGGRDAIPATEDGYVWTLASADFTTHSARLDYTDPGFGFFDWRNYDPLWNDTTEYFCPGFVLTIDEFSATISLGIETTTLSATFEGSAGTEMTYPDSAGPTLSTRAIGSFTGTFTASVPDWAAPGDLYFVGEGVIQANSSIDAVCSSARSDIGTRSVSESKSTEGVAKVTAELRPSENNTVLNLSLIIDGCTPTSGGVDSPCPVVWVESTSLGIPEE